MHTTPNPKALNFKRPFKRRSRKQQLEGVQLAKEEAVPIAFNPFLPGEQFHPIPDPTHIDDWFVCLNFLASSLLTFSRLAQFAEKGQSFKEWNESKHVSFDYRNPNSPRKVVYVIAIGEDLAEAKVNTVSKAVTIAYVLGISEHRSFEGVYICFLSRNGSQRAPSVASFTS